MGDHKYRRPASTGRKSETGQKRFDIYSRVHSQINKAKGAECWLEVITLTESLIADRLEARLAHLADQRLDGRKTMTAAQAAKALRSSADAADPVAMALYDAVGFWARSRNSALHELAKLFETTTDDWGLRYAEAKIVADAGIALLEKLKAHIKRLNKPPAKKKKKRSKKI